MKRILIAGLLAVGIHGLLLEMEFGWLKRRFFIKPTQRPVAITLAVKQRQIPEKAEENKPPAVPENRPFDGASTPKKKKILTVPTPERQKRRKPSVEPVEKTRPKIAPETASEPSKGVGPVEMKHQPQAPATEEARKPAGQTMIEARPLYRINPPPKYPAMARRRGYTGQVVLDVLVGQNGSVVELRVFTSSGYDILDNAAVAAVKTWLFEPGLKGSKKAEMWVRVPIRFELK